MMARSFLDLDPIHWVFVLWPVPLMGLAVALYLVKRKTGLQGWRRVVPGNIHAGIHWIARGVSMAIGFVCFKMLKKVPWKPILIWGPWIVAVLVVGFVLEENWRGARALEQVRAEWEARGQSLDVREFLPEPIPDEDNFARHPAVLGQMRGDPEVNGPQRGDLAGFTTEKREIWNGKPDLGTPVDVCLWLPVKGRPTDEKEAAQRCLELFAPIEEQMAGIAEAARRPGCSFEFQALGGFYGGWENPLMMRCLGIADAFRSRAVLYVRTGDGGRAVRDGETILRIAGMAGTDPTILGALVEAALLRQLAGIVWEGLHAQVWSDAQLHGLDELLGELDLPKRGFETTPSEAAILMENYRAVADDREHAEYGEPLGFLKTRWTPGWWEDLVEEVQDPLVYVMPRGWFDLWLVDALQRIDRAVLRPDGVEADRLTVPMAVAMEREHQELELSYMGYLRKMLVPQFGQFAKRIIHVQGEVDLMRVAIALERHRLRTGKYPAGLDGLMPREMAAIPRDLVTGKALRYRIKPDGTPLVYAVGFNEVDDGGVPAYDKEDLDWVWQYTGTPGQTEQDWRRGRAPKTP